MKKWILIAALCLKMAALAVVTTSANADDCSICPEPECFPFDGCPGS
jgi:hypothetical protein